MSTNTLDRLADVSMDAENWVPTSSFRDMPKIRKILNESKIKYSFSEYQNAKNFLLEYGIMLKNIHGLDVSFVEIALEQESVLSWYDVKSHTLKSVTLTEDEEGFEIYVSASQNGEVLSGKSFKSLNEFTCEI